MEQMTFNRLQDVRRQIPPRELRRLHLEMIDAIETLQKCEANVIKKLQEIDRYLVHRFIGYKSLRQYAIQALRLSPDQAEALITVARKAVALPALQEAIEKGEVTAYKAVRVTAVMNERNQEHWLHLLKYSTKREIEREVAKVSPRAVLGERVRFLNEHLLEMQLPIAETSFEKIERARALMAQGKRRVVSREEAIETVFEFWLERHDPLRKAERAQKRAEKRRDAKNSSSQSLDQKAHESVSASANQTTSSTRPRPKESDSRNDDPIDSTTKHAVNLRDRMKCQHRLPNGEVCGEDRFIDIHHIVSRARGGTNNLENLITLCKPHHELAHCSPIQVERLH